MYAKSPMEVEASELKMLWPTLEQDKGDLIRRCEQYAMWTVPSVCPEDVTEGAEQTRGNVEIGARIVNHLANKVVSTMWPNHTPFFDVDLSAEAQLRLQKEFDEEQLVRVEAEVKKATENLSRTAMSKLNLTSYIPVAILAVKHQIVTGNAFLHRPDNGERVVYGIKDYCVIRDNSGRLTFALLRDCKKFESLDAKMQELVRQHHTGQHLQGDTKLELYTRYMWKRGKWHSDQCIDNVEVPGSRRSYTEATFPGIALTWNLHKGENYGRGHVEDNAVAFHNLDVMSVARIDLIGILADIKWLVNPGSITDPDELNNAPRGHYVAGVEGDITTPEFPKRFELAALNDVIEKSERNLSAAFLYNTASVRDAERVTAEEIRMFARELESSFGGVYSNLALNWQHREATYLLSTVDFSLSEAGVTNFDVRVTAGLESLAKDGQLDALRLAIGDLQMLEAVPESVRYTMDESAFASHVFSLRGVNLQKFMLSKDQLEAKKEADRQQEERMIQMQSAAKAAEGASVAAAKGQQ